MMVFVDMSGVQDAHHTTIDDFVIIVDYSRQQLMPGWIPRRLGQLFFIIYFSFGTYSAIKFNSKFFIPLIQQQGVALGVRKNQDNFVLEEEKDHFVLPCKHLNYDNVITVVFASISNT